MLGALFGSRRRAKARAQVSELTAEGLWTQVSGRLREALNDATYQTWFALAEGRDLNEDAFVLSLPNDFTREWIEGHFVDLIGAVVKDVTGQSRRVQLAVAAGAPAPAVV